MAAVLFAVSDQVWLAGIAAAQTVALAYIAWLGVRNGRAVKNVGADAADAAKAAASADEASTDAARIAKEMGQNMREQGRRNDAE